MKKLKVLLGSCVLLLSSVVSSNSVEFPELGMPSGLAIGVSGSIGGYAVSGTETENGEVEKESAHILLGHQSVFLEYSIPQAMGLTIGVDYVTTDLESNIAERTDVSMNSITTEDDEGTSTVQVDFTDMTTLYVEIPILTSGLFIKAGIRQVDVITNEVLHTGSAYGNFSINGDMFGIGGKHVFDNGLLVKMEGTYTEYDSHSETSTTNADNTIQMTSLEGGNVTLSIGKSF
jgi:hypothetical protein